MPGYRDLQPDGPPPTHPSPFHGRSGAAPTRSPPRLLPASTGRFPAPAGRKRSGAAGVAAASRIDLESDEAADVTESRVRPFQVEQRLDKQQGAGHQQKPCAVTRAFRNLTEPRLPPTEPAASFIVLQRSTFKACHAGASQGSKTGSHVRESRGGRTAADRRIPGTFDQGNCPQ